MPNISDVRIVRGLLEVHGVSVTHGVDEGELILDPSAVETAHMADIDAHAGSSRIPILFCGPLLHRLGEAFIPDLGGCRIGDRPIDYHLEVLRNFGAIVEKLPSGIRMSAPNGLHGAKVALPYPSVGATEQVLLTAVLADGITELSGAAIEPEIMDLINILQKMGAIITVDTDRVIRIEGVEKLQGYTHRALFDRNEAASWAAAALATDGDIFVGGARQAEMLTFLNVFRKVGGDFEIQEDGIRFFHPGGELKPVIIETDVHPGFMTDWQQPLVVALTKAKGVSIVHETVYEQRFGFVDALVEMGASIDVHKECLGGRRVPLRPAQLPALRRHLGPDAAARRRHRGPRPPRRLQPPHRGAHGRRAARPSRTSGSSRAGTRTSSRSSSSSGRTSNSKDNGGVPHDDPSSHDAASKPRSEKRRPSFFWFLAVLVLPIFNLAVALPLPPPRADAADRRLRARARTTTARSTRSSWAWRAGSSAVRRGSSPRRRSSRTPCSAGCCARSGQIPVERAGSKSHAALRAAEELVEKGRMVVVYPEGSLTREPDLWPMRGKTGAVRIALERDIPIVPAAHWGTQALLAALRQEAQPVPPQDHRRRSSASRSTSAPTAASRSTRRRC